MATEIKNLSVFIQAVQDEFYLLHPDVYRDFCHFLGVKIDHVKQDILNEAEYIEKWRLEGFAHNL